MKSIWKFSLSLGLIFLFNGNCDNDSLYETLYYENLPKLSIISIYAVDTNHVEIELSHPPKIESLTDISKYSIIQTNEANTEITIQQAYLSTEGTTIIVLNTTDLSSGQTYELTIRNIDSPQAQSIDSTGITQNFTVSEVYDTRPVQLYSPENQETLPYVYETMDCVSEAKTCDLPVGMTCQPEDYLCPEEYNQLNLSLMPEFNWSERLGSTSFTIEIATDKDFADIVLSKEVTDNQYTLDPNDLNSDSLNYRYYYWRITANYPSTVEQQTITSNHQLINIVNPFATYVYSLSYEEIFQDDLCAEEEAGIVFYECNPAGHKYIPFYTIGDAITHTLSMREKVNEELNSCTSCQCDVPYQIFVAEGNYIETITLSDGADIQMIGGYHPGEIQGSFPCMDEDLTYNPSEDWIKDEECAEDYVSVLNGTSSFATVIFTFNDSTGDSSIQGFTINQNKQSTFGVLFEGSSGTLNNNTIYGKIPILCMTGSTAMITNNDIFAENTATNGHTIGIELMQEAAPSITGNRINTDSQSGVSRGYFCYGIYSKNASPMITDNIIYAGDAEKISVGILIDNLGEGLMTTIERNTIISGDILTNYKSGYSAGINATNINNASIINNIIKSGSTVLIDDILLNAGFSAGVFLERYANIYFQNNTVLVGPTYSTSSSYGLFLGQTIATTGEDKIFIDNNLFYLDDSQIGANRVCVYESALESEVNTLRNNDFYFSGGASANRFFYIDADNLPNSKFRAVCSGSGNLDQVSSACAFPLSDPVGSGNVNIDPDFVNPDNDWHLNSLSGNCNVRQGGIDDSFGDISYQNDRDNETRTSDTACSPTNTDARGWSIGAYEND